MKSRCREVYTWALIFTSWTFALALDNPTAMAENCEDCNPRERRLLDLLQSKDAQIERLRKEVARAGLSSSLQSGVNPETEKINADHRALGEEQGVDAKQPVRVNVNVVNEVPSSASIANGYAMPSTADGSLAPDCILASAAAADCKSELAASNSELAASKSELAASNQKFQLLAQSSMALTAGSDAENIEGGIDWAKCVSEGGKANCARCRNSGGVLPCEKVEAGHLRFHKHGARATACPDSDLYKTLKFFLVTKAGANQGKGRCQPVVKENAVRMTWRFPHLNASDPQPGKREILNMVATKAKIVKVDLAARDAGMLIFKRLVTHTCTGKTSACIKGTTVADVTKDSYCVVCPKKKEYCLNCRKNGKEWKQAQWKHPALKRTNCKDQRNPSKLCSIFGTIFNSHALDEEKVRFAKDCLRAAFDKDGAVKDTYSCTGQDARSAAGVAMGF